MMRPRHAGTGMRLLRTAVFTAVCVTLSAAGHTLAAGQGVPVWELFAAWAAVFAVVAPLAGRQRGLPGIATGLAACQIALHLLFSAGEMCAQRATGRTETVMALAGQLLCAGHSARLTPLLADQVVRRAGIDPARIAAAGTAHPAGTAAHGLPGMTSSVTHTAMSYSLSMLLGHLLAALAAGWLLRRGDAALWRLVELSAGVVRRAHSLVRVLIAGAPGGLADAPRRVGRIGYGRAALPRTALLRHTLARRGPPAFALAA